MEEASEGGHGRIGHDPTVVDGDVVAGLYQGHRHPRVLNSSEYVDPPS